MMNCDFWPCLVFALTFNLVTCYKIHLLPSPKSDIADGAHWDVQTQSLYYVDLSSSNPINPTLNRYDYKENRVYSASIRNRTAYSSFIIPLECRKNEFAVGVGRNIEVVYWDGISDEATIVGTVINVEPQDFYSTNSLNDAKADPTGRLYAGTERSLFCKSDPTVANASLYSYSKCCGLTQHVTNVGSSNGLVWNKNKNLFYYADSCAFFIREFDWDPISGNISNPRIAYDFRINGKFPGFVVDGMTIDRDGNLWAGLLKGNHIVSIDPKYHKIVERIRLPAHQVVSGAFGGPNLDELFVTTGGKPFDIQIGERDTVPEPPLSGHLFKITGLKRRGYPPNKVKCL